ncbi:uncharacterized protein BDW47DRAFT_105124 [Aspergillus candidus]|uniref:Uncharacterized protein n=1 Tax=Aspergillus candidus TaxID=41067 RepID=A0A2I2FCC0_ASPCN|nr:hypothetical protein BDW47DRAFT_105124 [Aspergillus candidus]PLB38281.1 hypothetical protein BDW47DRAFT_105124 [Aspergillus candidus]
MSISWPRAHNCKAHRTIPRTPSSAALMQEKIFLATPVRFVAKRRMQVKKSTRPSMDKVFRLSASRASRCHYRFFDL